MAKKQTTKKISISDERLLDLLQRIDTVMSEAKVNTVEMLTVARQMTVSALAQVVRDNPQASPTALIDDVTQTLHRALTARILQPQTMAVGEA